MKFAEKQLMSKFENSGENYFITKDTYQENFNNIVIYPKAITGAERDEVSGDCFKSINEKHEPFMRYGATKLLMYVYGDTREQAKNRALRLIKDDYEDKPQEQKQETVLPIVEMNGRYWNTLNNQPVTDFTIKVTKKVDCIDDEEFSYHEVEVTPCNGNKFYRKFGSLDMVNVDSFKKALNSNYVTFSGKLADMNNIKKLIFNNNYPTQKVVSYGGFRYADNKLLYIEKNGCYCDGVVSTEYLLNDSVPTLSSDLLDVEEISAYEIAELEKHIFNFNSKSTVYSILGFGSMCFFKYLLKNGNVKIPHLMAIGEAGAGKSATTNTILLNLFGLSEAYSASNITKYSIDNLTASNTTVPLILDEYKPYKMAKWRVNLISEVMRNVYDGHKSARGTGKGTIKELIPITNIALIGEAGTDETAILERSITLSMCKRDTLIKGQSDSFEWIMDHKELLTKLGRKLLTIAYNIPQDVVAEYFNAYSKAIPEIVKTPRVRQALACNMVGLKLLKTVFPSLDLKEALNVISQNSVEEVGENTKSMVELTLEEIDRALPILVKHSEHDYELYTLINDDAEVAVRFYELYDLFTAYLKNANKQFDVLNCKEFIKQLRKSQYFSRYNVAKFGLVGDENFPQGKTKVKVIKAYILHVDKLSELGINNFIKK